MRINEANKPGRSLNRRHTENKNGTATCVLRRLFHVAIYRNVLMIPSRHLHGARTTAARRPISGALSSYKYRPTCHWKLETVLGLNVLPRHLPLVLICRYCCLEFQPRLCVCLSHRLLSSCLTAGICLETEHRLQLKIPRRLS